LNQKYEKTTKKDYQYERVKAYQRGGPHKGGPSFPDYVKGKKKRRGKKLVPSC